MNDGLEWEATGTENKLMNVPHATTEAILSVLVLPCTNKIFAVMFNLINITVSPV